VSFSCWGSAVVERARGELVVASRGVVAEIDEQLAVLDGELARNEQLVADRERLVAARAALLGEDRPAAQITWQDVSAYLAEYPGSRAGEIAEAFETQP
jgi:glutathione S-transferase